MESTRGLELPPKFGSLLSSPRKRHPDHVNWRKTVTDKSDLVVRVVFN